MKIRIAIDIGSYWVYRRDHWKSCTFTQSSPLYFQHYFTMSKIRSKTKQCRHIILLFSVVCLFWLLWTSNIALPMLYKPQNTSHVTHTKSPFELLQEQVRTHFLIRNHVNDQTFLMPGTGWSGIFQINEHFRTTWK